MAPLTGYFNFILVRDTAHTGGGITNHILGMKDDPPTLLWTLGNVSLRRYLVSPFSNKRINC